METNVLVTPKLTLNSTCGFDGLANDFAQTHVRKAHAVARGFLIAMYSL